MLCSSANQLLFVDIKVTCTVADLAYAWLELLNLVLTAICKQVADRLLVVLIVALAVVYIAITVHVYVVLSSIALPKVEVDKWIEVHVCKRHLLLCSI